MEYEEAPLDLSASNTSSVSSPPRSPDYNRDHERNSGSPAQDSDDSDSLRKMPRNPAKSYKKAIMKRYLDTESSPIVTHVTSRHIKSSSNSRQQHRQQQHKIHSFYTPEEEDSGLLKLVDTLELQHKDRPIFLQEFMAPDRLVSENHKSNKPSASSVYLLKEPGHVQESYAIHPASHVGHRTAYSVSHPNNSVTKGGIRIASDLYESHHDSSQRQIRHHPSSHNQSSLRRNSLNQNDSFHPHQLHRDEPLNLEELKEPGPFRRQINSNNSSVYNPMHGSKIVYTIHPADHEGQQTTYTISHPNIFGDGSRSPPKDDSEVLEIVDSRGSNQGFQRRNSNRFDLEYADIDVHFPSANSNTIPEGLSLSYLDGPALQFDGNLVNMQNAIPYNLSPQDQTFNDPVETQHNIYANVSGLEVNTIDPRNSNVSEEKRTRVVRAKPKQDIVINLSQSCLDVVLRKVPGVGGRARWPKSWEFVMRLIMHEETNPYLVAWEDESQYIFRLMQSETITYIWNTNSPRACDSYNNFARSLRYHYKKKILIPIRERQLVYQCGPKAIDYIKKMRLF